MKKFIFLSMFIFCCAACTTEQQKDIYDVPLTSIRCSDPFIYADSSDSTSKAVCSTVFLPIGIRSFPIYLEYLCFQPYYTWNIKVCQQLVKGIAFGGILPYNKER